MVLAGPAALSFPPDTSVALAGPAALSFPSDTSVALAGPAALSFPPDTSVAGDKRKREGLNGCIGPVVSVAGDGRSRLPDVLCAYHQHHW